MRVRLGSRACRRGSLPRRCRCANPEVRRDFVSATAPGRVLGLGCKNLPSRSYSVVLRPFAGNSGGSGGCDALQAEDLLASPERIQHGDCRALEPATLAGPLAVRAGLPGAVLPAVILWSVSRLHSPGLRLAFSIRPVSITTLLRPSVRWISVSAMGATSDRENPSSCKCRFPPEGPAAAPTSTGRQSCHRSP